MWQGDEERKRGRLTIWLEVGELLVDELEVGLAEKDIGQGGVGRVGGRVARLDVDVGMILVVVDG